MHLSIPKIPEPLNIWEKVEILTSADSKAGLYVARIEDFVDDGLVVTYPELIKGNVLLRDNCEIFLHITKADAIYRFHSKIRKIKNNGRELYFLSKPIFIKRVQRREFARVVYSTSVEYTMFDETYSPDQKWYRSYSRDISGNGILMEVKDFIKKESLLLLRIKLFDDLTINPPVLGRSFRIANDNNIRLSGVGLISPSEIVRFKRNYLTNLSTKYSLNFNHSAQEKLIAFVFNQQIEQRKRGLL